MGSHQKSPPPANYGQPISEGPWSTGLYDCSSDLSNCCMTCWCPCVTFKQIAEIVDQGSPSHGGAIGAFYTLVSVITGCGCLYSWIYRKKMRKLYMLPEDPCNDFLVHCLCEPCALCQEYRELKSRGFDMSLGWQGNVERNQGVTIAPLSQAGMNR